MCSAAPSESTLPQPCARQMNWYAYGAETIVSREKDAHLTAVAQQNAWLRLLHLMQISGLSTHLKVEPGEFCLRGEKKSCEAKHQ